MLIRRSILWLLNISNSNKIFIILFLIMANLSVPMVIATGDNLTNILFYNWLIISLYLLKNAFCKYNTIWLQHKSLIYMDKITDKLFAQGKLNKEYLIRTYLGNKNSYLYLNENIILASKNPEIKWKVSKNVLEGTVVANKKMTKLNNGIVKPTDLEIKSAIPSTIKTTTLMEFIITLVLISGFAAVLNLFTGGSITPGFMLVSILLVLSMVFVLNIYYAFIVEREIPRKRVKTSWNKINTISTFNAKFIDLLIKYEENPGSFDNIYKQVKVLPDTLKESIFIQQLILLIEEEQGYEVTS